MRVLEAFGSPLALVLFDIEEGKMPDLAILADVLRSNRTPPKEVLECAADLIDPRVKDKGGRPVNRNNNLLFLLCQDLSAVRSEASESFTLNDAFTQVSDNVGVAKAKLRKFFYQTYVPTEGSRAIRELLSIGKSDDDAISIAAEWLGVREQTIRKHCVDTGRTADKVDGWGYKTNKER